jgi:hypothetical protein
MKTQEEIEAAVCEGISRFEQEYRGRGRRSVRRRKDLSGVVRSCHNADLGALENAYTKS